MKLGVTFGTTDTKEVFWYRTLDDFPKLINFLGRNWEWVFYDSDPTGKLDSILVFAELPTYDPNFDVVCFSWTHLFGNDKIDCECGSRYGSFSWDHMRFCNKWRPWSQI